MHPYTNNLINETSPYLLQHAHNPVDWYPWGNEALQKANLENKPILVSIGYAACHWCHVMEKESFEDETTAEIMNKNFVNIKIDREERPDLDHIYMDAVQAMTGTGGWPLNVFLTPDAKPFYGGTYFPPSRAYNRPAWKDVLLSVANAFHEKRNEIDEQAENLTEHLVQSNSFIIQKQIADGSFQKENLQKIFLNIMEQADKERGGFGKAPKFPQTFTILFLLRYYYITQKDEALHQAILSLDKMIEGGIYDQIGGGFARYSTDEEWLAPHFEKMLYDNALLISVLSEAFQLTKRERYKEAIGETIEFVQRELLHPLGGFYSSLDADSEGEEGNFYVWEYNDVKNILGNDADIFCEYYDITQHGNWEGKNILRMKRSFERFAVEQKIDVGKLKKILQDGKKKLFEKRKNRIRPSTDDKIILGWNALMNSACSKAFAATGEERYRQQAISNMRFLLKDLLSSHTHFYHVWKNGIAKQSAFLDDYAFLIEALIHLHEITADQEWLHHAKVIAEFVIENFSDDQSGFFFFTNRDQNDIIARKKEIYDGATPSGNSVMAYNLYHLSIFFDKKEWRERSQFLISTLEQTIIRYPTSFGIWGCLLQEMIAGTQEIVLTGRHYFKDHIELLGEYIPHRILLVAGNPDPAIPILSGKAILQVSSLWLCRDFICLPPVNSVADLIRLIDKREQVE